MKTIRQPAVSGQFYPNDPATLQTLVQQYLQQASTTDCTIPRALIAPHAGYIYSGAVAGAAYACLDQAKARIHRIVLLGPAHFVHLTGLALPSVDYFATPLGDIRIDDAMRQEALQLPGVILSDAAHEKEHSLEVQLPFLQILFNEFSILPIAVGHCAPEAIATLLAGFVDDPHTLIVISSDLSHYHAYEEAKQLDLATSEAILNMRLEKVQSAGACGAVPIRGLLACAKVRHWHSRLIALCNSGDTAGPKDRVVGYGAYHFYE